MTSRYRDQDDGWMMEEVDFSPEQRTGLEEYLNKSQINELRIHVQIALAMKQWDRNLPTDAERKKKLSEVATLADSLRNALVELSEQDQDDIEFSACIQFANKRLNLINRVCTVIDELHQSAEYASHEISPRRGARPDHARAFLAQRALELATQAGIEVKDNNHGPAATVLKTALEAASMPTDDVRKRLRDWLNKERM